MGAKKKKRSEGNSATSISMRSDVLEAARSAAADENRTLSNWLETLLIAELGDPNNNTNNDKAKR